MFIKRYNSEDVFTFLSEKCSCFSQALDLINKGELAEDIKQVCCQNILCMQYPQAVAEDFLKLSPDFEEEEINQLTKKAAEWKEKSFHCYSCSKMGCNTEEDILKCFKSCEYRDDGTLRNSIYSIANRKEFEIHQLVTDARDGLEVVMNTVCDGNKDVAYQEKSIQNLAIISRYDSKYYEEVIQELEDKKVKVSRIRTEVEKEVMRQKSVESGDNFASLTLENTSEELKKYVDFQSQTSMVVSADGALYKEKTDSDGNVSHSIVCNCIPEITAKFIFENEVDSDIVFRVELVLDGSKRTENVLIPSSKIGSLDYYYQYFGDQMIVYGSFADIRCFMQEVAGDIESVVITYSLGWKKSLTGKWSYCFSGESLGESSVYVADIKELPGYTMVHSEDITLNDGFTALQKFEELMPEKKGEMTALLSYSIGSVLNEKMTELEIPPKFLVWVHGQTGSFKTECAKLLASFFGEIENPASNFQDTVAALEKKMHLCKDAVLLIDDFCPSSTLAEERAKISKANMVTRNIGDRVSRGRAKSNMSLSKSYVPRGNVIITGEDVIGGVSTIARHLTIHIGRGDVDADTLTWLQNHKQFLNKFMQEFILYVKENIMDNCEIDLKELFLQYRGEAQEVKHHRRFADTVAIIRLYHYVLMQFLVDEQLITEQESSDRAEFVHQEMTKMIEQQNDMVLGEDPAELFMRAISEMILSNEMIPLTANKPEHSLASKSVVFKEKDYYYFIPTTTYAKVIDFYRRRDKNFVTSERATWNALKGKDILELAPQNDGHADYKILKRIGNRNARVIVIKKSIVESY